MLNVVVPETELFDPISNTFLYVKETSLSLEHSLVSLSKWESKWHKPFLGTDKKTNEETIDYIRCMTISQNVNPLVYKCLTANTLEQIMKYIEDPMTATSIKSTGGNRNGELVTSELIYYWMTVLNIPFDPCQKWHFNKLIALIKTCSVKSQPSKKMKKGDIMRQNHSLNAARRAARGSRG